MAPGACLLERNILVPLVPPGHMLHINRGKQIECVAPEV